MHNRNKRRVARIKKDLEILQILDMYGYRVRADMDRDQQFSCDLHGSGLDQKPSARIYYEDNTWYCFGCDKTRDAIETVREKEGLGFMDALKWLERKFKLPFMPFDDDYVPKKTISQEIAETLRPHKTFDDDVRRVRSLLDPLAEEKSAPMDKVLRWWEAFDKVVHLVKGKDAKVPEAQGRLALEKIRLKVMGHFE